MQLGYLAVSNWILDCRSWSYVVRGVRRQSCPSSQLRIMVLRFKYNVGCCSLRVAIEFRNFRPLACTPPLPKNNTRRQRNSGWLAGSLARWLAGSLARWLARGGWLAGWLARWRAGWLAGYLAGYLARSLTRSLARSLVQQLAGSLVRSTARWLAGSLDGYLARSLARWPAGWRVYLAPSLASKEIWNGVRDGPRNAMPALARPP